VTWAKSFKEGMINPQQIKLIQRGFDPFDFTKTKLYSKLKVRRYRRRRKGK